jgi:GT2 family glycosyltransferase
VVLGYNGLDLTRATLASLRKQSYPTLRVLFVDNGSADGSTEAVLSEFPEVAVVRIPANIGFARGCNVGMAAALQAGADQLLLLNNDVEMAPDLTSRLVDGLAADPRAAMSVAKIFFFNPPKVIWSAGAAIQGFPPRLDLLHTTQEDDGRFDGLATLDFATLCCALVTREAVDRVGLLDPNFFLLYEDYEYCARLRQAGFSLRFVPDAHLWHKVSMTVQAGRPNPNTWYYRGRSKALFKRRHPEYGRVVWPGYGLAASARLWLRGQRAMIEPFRRGLREGRTMALAPVPHWPDPLDGGAEIVRP